MEIETFKALIPLIPGMITAGLDIWKNVVKPLLSKMKYNVSDEQEQEMLALEEKKDIETYIKKLEGICKEIDQKINIQNQTGNNNIQFNKNEGIFDNSTTTINIGTVPNESEVKKN